MLSVGLKKDDIKLRVPRQVGYLGIVLKKKIKWAFAYFYFPPVATAHLQP
jgi:hypothetical protein